MKVETRVKIIFHDSVNVSVYKYQNLEYAINEWFDKNPEIILIDLKLYNSGHEAYAVIIYKFLISGTI